ncbi:MAG: PTS sugar transporter subunit IIA [Treponema sp.]|jgi:mannitol/fructose-specific phosphotransferase system IIA component (Ntr-type)|nr:PTS sugar transporter subunit IIA [Treponema sp.]
MLLSDVFDTRHIKLDLESTTKDEAFEELTQTVIALHPELDREAVLESIIERENQMNTAVMPDIALPHGYCQTLKGIVGVIGVSHAGIAYESEQIVHYIFMTLMGGAEREKHLRVLSRLLNLCNSRAFSEIMAAQSGQEVCDILRRFDRTYTGRSS